MVDKSAIKDHTQVVASCGTHVGVVDHLDGERIKLAKSDPNRAASTTLFLSAGLIRSKIIKLS